MCFLLFFGGFANQCVFYTPTPDIFSRVENPRFMKCFLSPSLSLSLSVSRTIYFTLSTEQPNIVGRHINPMLVKYFSILIQ